MREITLQEMQQIELELLIAFDRVCKAHNLRYYMDGGTLLGAMCYEGFIPWDDDIDLKMPRPDYERFLGMQAELPENIRIESPSAAHSDYLMTKLVDTRTVLIEDGAVQKKTGVYLDIFPMDGHPDDENERIRHLQELQKWNARFHMSQDGFAQMRASRSVATKIKGCIYRLLYRPSYVAEKLTRLAKKYPYDACRRVGLLIEGNAEKECFPKEWLEPVIDLPFEGYRFPAPNGYKPHMEKFYGSHVTSEVCYRNLPQYPSNHSHLVYWKEEDSHGI